MKSARLSIFLGCQFCFVLVAESNAQTYITSDFTQNGGVLSTNNPPELLVIEHSTNNPTLTLTNGATTSGISGIGIGALGGTGHLRVEQGSVVTTLLNSSTSVENGSTVLITGTGSEFNSSFLWLGSNEQFSVLNGGKANIGQGFVGGPSNITVGGNGATMNVGLWDVGVTIDCNVNGIINVSGITNMWGTTGVINLNGGTFTTGSLYKGQGTINFNYGELIIKGGFLAGLYSQNPGALIVSPNITNQSMLMRFQAGATATGVEAFVVGNNGLGTLRIESGSNVATSGSGSLGTVGPVGISRGWTYVGLNATEGTLIVTGTGSTFTNPNGLILGHQAKGSMVVNNGGLAENGNASLGFGSPTSQGLASVAGNLSHWKINGQLAVGEAGYGLAQANFGGKITSTTANIGVFANSSGEIRLNGGEWQNSGQALIGNSGTGTLTLQSGNVVTGSAIVGHQFGSTGIANVSGATSTWTTSGALTVGNNGSGTLNVSGGGKVVASQAVAGAQQFGNGQILVDGAGSALDTVTLSIGGAGSGVLTVKNQATVSAINGVSINANGVLKGNLGTVQANVSNQGKIRPGDSIGTLTIAGDLFDLGTLEFEIAGLTSFDKLIVWGNYSAGGTVKVVLDNFSPVAGDSFDIMDFGTFTNAGYSFDFANAGLAPGLSWDTSLYSIQGIIRVVPEPGALALIGFSLTLVGLRRRGKNNLAAY